MDDSEFRCWSDDHIETMSNLENHRHMFIFHYCRNALERVSILNAKWYSCSDDWSEPEIIQQNALIKFVRNVLSLRWFRSNLTQENIDMLQRE
jgi:hypothetical protein